MENVRNVANILDRKDPETSQLAEIHKLPSTVWATLAHHVITESLTVKHVQSLVKELRTMLDNVPACARGEVLEDVPHVGSICFARCAGRTA